MALPRQFEADCMYCPQCGDEYRPEISICAECQVALVSGAQLAKSGTQEAGPQYTEIETHEELTAVRQGPVLQMRQLQDYLRASGLASLLTPGADGCCTKGCRGPEVELRVRTSELTLVLAALEQEHRQSTGLLDHIHNRNLAGAAFEVEVGQAACPACGCLFATDAPLCPDCGLRFV
ncbi:MAG: hypothetical protein ACOX4Z_12675 [Desulfobulbus sp.]|jgi:predicted amidophosphoribosyltransferase